jgi:hypothetical protein
MNRLFFLFLPLLLFAEFWNFPHRIDLKKDQTAYFDVYYKNSTYPFKFRWTLYKNGILTLLYRYDNFPRQITLYSEPPLNTFKVAIAKFPELYPYFYIEFKDFNGKIATFIMYLKNADEVRVDFKGKKWDILK